MDRMKTGWGQTEVGISCNCLLFGGASSASMLIVVPFKVAFRFPLLFEREGAYRLTVNWVAVTRRCAGIAGRMAGLIIFVEVVVLKKFGLVFCFILVAALFAAGAVFAADPHDPHGPVPPVDPGDLPVNTKPVESVVEVTVTNAVKDVPNSADLQETLGEIVDSEGNVTAATKAAVLEAFKGRVDEGAAAKVLVTPLFQAKLAAGDEGKVGVVEFPLLPATFGANYAGKIISDLLVVKILASGDYKEYAAATVMANLNDKCFTIVKSGDKVPFTGTIVSADTYQLWLAIKDNGSFDLDTRDGYILDPSFIAPATHHDDSSSGCSLGFAPAALLLVAPLFFLKRK